MDDPQIRVGGSPESNLQFARPAPARTRGEISKTNPALVESHLQAPTPPHRQLGKFTQPGTTSREQLIEDLRRAAPPGQVELDERVVQRLAAITIELGHHHRQRALETFARFIATTDRGLMPFDEAALRRLRGETILVTGGSGCIGSALLDELAKLQPTRLVSIARGMSQPLRRVAGVEYIEVDITSRDAVDLLFADLRPTVVFHLAAQRNPELAERAVARTISTNVFGTECLVSSARRHGVRLFVYASTGKALRFYTPDVYAASKKVGEWLVSREGSESAMACAIARFTHVVDNSIVRRKIVNWSFNGSPVRLHGPNVAFYLQSAREAAQLLISAALEAENGTPLMQAIRNLGEPADLLDLALGIGLALGQISPLYLSGFEAGYEEQPHPGLYDPLYSIEFSPLLNGLEAADGAPSTVSPEIDRVEIGLTEDQRVFECLEVLELSYLDSDSDDLGQALNALSWELLRTRLDGSPVDARRRALRRSRAAAKFLPLSQDHLRTTSALDASLPV